MPDHNPYIVNYIDALIASKTLEDFLETISKGSKQSLEQAYYHSFTQIQEKMQLKSTNENVPTIVTCAEKLSLEHFEVVFAHFSKKDLTSEIITHCLKSNLPYRHLKLLLEQAPKKSFTPKMITTYLGSNVGDIQSKILVAEQFYRLDNFEALLVGFIADVKHIMHGDAQECFFTGFLTAGMKKQFSFNNKENFINFMNAINNINIFYPKKQTIIAEFYKTHRIKYLSEDKISFEEKITFLAGLCLPEVIKHNALKETIERMEYYSRHLGNLVISALKAATKEKSISNFLISSVLKKWEQICFLPDHLGQVVDFATSSKIFVDIPNLQAAFETAVLNLMKRKKYFFCRKDEGRKSYQYGLMVNFSYNLTKIYHYNSALAETIFNDALATLDNGKSVPRDDLHRLISLLSENLRQEDMPLPFKSHCLTSITNKLSETIKHCEGQNDAHAITLFSYFEDALKNLHFLLIRLLQQKEDVDLALYEAITNCAVEYLKQNNIYSKEYSYNKMLEVLNTVQHHITSKENQKALSVDIFTNLIKKYQDSPALLTKEYSAFHYRTLREQMGHAFLDDKDAIKIHQQCIKLIKENFFLICPTLSSMADCIYALQDTQACERFSKALNLNVENLLEEIFKKNSDTMIQTFRDLHHFFYEFRPLSKTQLPSRIKLDIFKAHIQDDYIKTIKEVAEAFEGVKNIEPFHASDRKEALQILIQKLTWQVFYLNNPEGIRSARDLHQVITHIHGASNGTLNVQELADLLHPFILKFSPPKNAKDQKRFYSFAEEGFHLKHFLSELKQTYPDLSKALKKKFYPKLSLNPLRIFACSSKSKNNKNQEQNNISNNLNWPNY